MLKEAGFSIKIRKTSLEIKMDLPIKYHEMHYTERWKVREAYIAQQKGLCCHCKEPLDGDPPAHIMSKPVDKTLFPKGFFNHPIHLHHSHETGLTIGAIHCYCNAVLWQYYGE